MTDLDVVFEQLDDEINTALSEVQQAETDLRVKQAIFDRLMRLKPRINNRLSKVRQERDAAQGA